MKPGDIVKLRTGSGIFIDFETGLEVAGNRSATIGKVIGAATKAAFAAGGLVLKGKSEKDAAKAEKNAAKAEAKKSGDASDEE